jgi:hypothetical protein
MQCLDGVTVPAGKRDAHPERNDVGHMHARFKRSKDVNPKDIFECKFRSKNADSASHLGTALAQRQYSVKVAQLGVFVISE